LERELKKQIGRAVLKTLAEIKKNTPVDTGRLRNSIIMKETDSGFIIGTNLNYAEHIELGVEPHVIRPKNKKALYWKGAKYPVKKVNHPGFSGRFMFQKGATFFEKYLKTELKK